ncbi:MAG: HyaD/HybD family hydrogenase maturation endopeptidase [Ignavibacteria bacterium]|jgi:hydrogenase maturation protease
MKNPIMVIGVGNLIQMDDGFGIHVLNELSKYEMPAEVELFDGGTLGIDLMPWIEGREKLIFIDCVKGGNKPGIIYKFRPEDLTYEEEIKISVHQIGLIESLQMIAMTGNAPDKITIFGVEPNVIDWGEELTDELKRVIPKVVKLVIREIEESINEIKNSKLEETNG